MNASWKLGGMLASIASIAMLAGMLIVTAPAVAVAGPADADVTFTKDVAPIFQNKCQACHREGSMAPMSFESYQEVRPWARAIKAAVASREMPPWHIDKTVGIPGLQERSLSERRPDRHHRPMG